VTSSIRPGELPPHALLARYRGDGAFTDCWITELPRTVTAADHVEAFYTSRLFAIERRLLAWFASKPSTAGQARLLGDGRADAFAAWTVEARTPDQLLLRDITGRTRSWLMAEPLGSGAGTRLYFGSAVLARRDAATGAVSLGAAFHALSGFHAAYSRALLRAARARLMRVGAVPDGGSGAAPRTAPEPAVQPSPTPEPRRPRPAFRERPTREQIAALPPFDPLPIGRIVLVDSTGLAEAALRAMRQARFVGFDTESRPTFTRDAVRDGPHVIQFATTQQGFIVQVNARTPLDFLRAVLESEEIVKVGFGLDSDRAPLEHKLATTLRASVEVSHVLRGLGHRQALGAKAAVAVVLGRRLQKSKAVSTSNWGAERLTASQLVYAANDAYAALKVYEAMGSPYPVRPAGAAAGPADGRGRRRS